MYILSNGNIKPICVWIHRFTDLTISRVYVVYETYFMYNAVRWRLFRDGGVDTSDVIYSVLIIISAHKIDLYPRIRLSKNRFVFVFTA